MKKNIHPKWYKHSIVYGNGQQILTVGSTKPELHVEVWSSIHPFYTGSQKQLDIR